MKEWDDSTNSGLKKALNSPFLHILATFGERLRALHYLMAYGMTKLVEANALANHFLNINIITLHTNLIVNLIVNLTSLGHSIDRCSPDIAK